MKIRSSSTACHEGNLGLLNILVVVARAEEKAAAEAAAPGAR